MRGYALVAYLAAHRLASTARGVRDQIGARMSEAPRARRTDPDVDDALTALLDALKVDTNPTDPSTIRLDVHVTTWPWSSQHSGQITVHEDGQHPRHVQVQIPT